MPGAMDRVVEVQTSGSMPCLRFVCCLAGTVPLLLRLSDGVIEFRQCVDNLGLRRLDSRDMYLAVA